MKRFDRYVGFVSPPASFDITPQQLLSLCADPVGIVQNLSHYPGAAYDSPSAEPERRLSHLRDGIAGLRDAHAEIVLQVGGYWSMPYIGNIESARELQDELTVEYGVTVILNWAALADALVDVGAKRISIAAGYYRPSWTAASVDFFATAGFDVMWSGDIIDQGLVADEAEKLEIEAATRWDYPNQIVQGACIGAAEAAPDCDAICQIGAGMRTSYVVAEVEAQTGKPLVATDLAAHWAVMRAAGLRSRPGLGRLLDTLA